MMNVYFYCILEKEKNYLVEYLAVKFYYSSN